MMLRYIYFVSLLFCLSLSQEEIIRSGRKHFRNIKKHGMGKNHRKRSDYDAFDDKESVAQIDVANFIRSPDDTSFNYGYEQNIRRPASNYFDDNLVINAEYDKDKSQDYQGFESDNIPEVNIYSKKRIRQYENSNTHPTAEMNEKFYKSHEAKSVKDDNSVNTHQEHKTHAEKKCILKNMKIPFFSRDKVTTAKTKKNKKRRLFGFRNSKKNTNLTKLTGSNSNDRLTTKEPQSFKVNKRSYFEKLCPVCKRKFMSNSNTDFMEKVRRTANNMIHNSRQYYQNKMNGKAESNVRSSSPPIKHENLNTDPRFDYKNFNSYMKEKRR